MSPYVYKGTQGSQSVPLVEEARRRNAVLRHELAALTAENTQLESKVEAMRLEVTTARRKLSRQIRDLEAIRIQTRNIASLATQAASTEPVHGGREGLQAAADEIESYEGKPGATLGTVRRRNPRHGTGRKYNTGCRCEDCLGWRKKRTDQEVARQQRRRDEFQALKAAAEVAT